MYGTSVVLVMVDPVEVSSALVVPHPQVSSTRTPAQAVHLTLEQKR